MIITRTPFRISFVGGGSDMPSFYHKHEGCVLSATINKYMYITIHPTFNQIETIVKYSKTETVEDIRRIQHPTARQLLLEHNINGVEIVSTADIPSGTGLSSSSAYTVGLIHAIYAYKGKYCSQEKIAHEACKIEIEALNEPIGKQDQYGTAIGGMKLIRFLPNDSVQIEPVIISNSTLKQLNENLLLFYTGITRNSSDILEEQSKLVSKEKDKYNNLITMTSLAYKLREELTKGNIDVMGEILHENWILKKSLSSHISNDIVNEYYDTALKNGALGGKLLGAGGGGFLLFYCPKEKQQRLLLALNNLTYLPFEFETTGTKVVYVGEKNWE